MVSAEFDTVNGASEQFWQFSLTLYPMLQTELLALQDQYNCNINVLLLTVWCPLLAPLPVLMQGLSPQHLTTQHIRQLRRDLSRQLKDHPTDPMLAKLRQQLLAAELTAERLEQRALLQCCADQSHCTVVATTVRQQYLDSHQVPAPIQQQLTFDLDQALLQLGLPQPFPSAKA
ncbi:MAG: DUF2390 domain-containing protein [Rheinheimera sp.]|nr:DUF2390 domain-containing protein [Rheinheimera sp.]